MDICPLRHRIEHEPSTMISDKISEDHLLRFIQASHIKSFRLLKIFTFSILKLDNCSLLRQTSGVEVNQTQDFPNYLTSNRIT